MFVFIAVNKSRTGGSELLWMDTALHLLRQGHKVRALVPDQPHPAFDEAFTQLGGELVKYTSYTNSLWGKLKYYLWGDPVFNCVEKNTREKDALAIVSQGGCYDGLLFVEVCRENKVPYAIIHQAVRTEDWPSDEHAMRILSTYEKAEQNFFVSKGNIELFRLMLGSDLRPVDLIFNHGQLSRTQTIPWPVADGEFRLACVALLDPHRKGIDLALQALSHPRWQARNLKVTFYGTGACKESLRRNVERLGITNIVEFAGHASPGEIWQRNHGLLLPSRSEGFPLALTEAMMANRFGIVTADVGDNAKVISDGKNGFLIQSPGVSEVDKALEAAWKKRNQWQKIGVEAGKTIRKYLPKDPVAYFANKLIALAAKESEQATRKEAA